MIASWSPCFDSKKSGSRFFFLPLLRLAFHPRRNWRAAGTPTSPTRGSAALRAPQKADPAPGAAPSAPALSQSHGGPEIGGDGLDGNKMMIFNEL